MSIFENRYAIEIMKQYVQLNTVYIAVHTIYPIFNYPFFVFGESLIGEGFGKEEVSLKYQYLQ